MQRFRQIARASGWVLAVAVVGVVAWNARPARGAEEWPKWRGPHGDNIVRAEGLLDRWPEGGPRKIWSPHYETIP